MTRTPPDAATLAFLKWVAEAVAAKAFVAGDSTLFEQKYKQPFSARTARGRQLRV